MVLTLSALAIAGPAGAASASSPAANVKAVSAAVTPNLGQSSNLVLETDAGSYNFNSSGFHYDEAYLRRAYFIFPGGWSGYVFGTDGASYPFCDLKNRSLPWPVVESIYLSPTKESFC